MKKKSKKIRLNGTDAGAKWDKILLWNGWIIFIKRHTGEKEISFSFRSAVFSFIIWSISGDNTKKVKMSFFSTYFPCFCRFSSATMQNISSCFTPLNMSQSTRTQLTSNKLNYDIFRNTLKKNKSTPLN